VIRGLRILGAQVRRALLESLSWRGFLVTLVVNQAVTPLLGLAVWSAALPGRSEITAYYAALLVVQLATVSYEHHTLSNGIYADGLTGDLLRPQPQVLGPLGQNLALRVWHLLFGLPVVVAAVLAAGAPFAPAPLLVAVPAIVLAAALRFLFTYTLALSAFWTQRAHGVVGFGETLIFVLGGAAAPVPLLPAAVRELGKALPFRAMLGFPAEVAAGGLDAADLVEGYAWQAGWTAAFALAALVAWRTGVRRYTAHGA
jgi:ABC-2 type transport system permease protein